MYKIDDNSKKKKKKKRKDVVFKKSLYNNFVNLQSLVTFSEAKNSAIIGAAGAIIAFIFSKVSFSSPLHALFSVGYLFIGLSVLISFLSFFPIDTKNANNSKIGLKSALYDFNSNLFYFKDIANFRNYEEYMGSLKKRYYKNIPLSNADIDLIRQIFSLAVIVERKLDYFRRAVKLFFFGIILVTVCGIFII
jgi:hypothetical protein